MNSPHSNVLDKAVTTPTETSMRRTMVIKLIINREWGLSMNENPLQGAIMTNELTDLVEEVVLAVLDQLSKRGGMLGSIEKGYQRGQIQD
jgi:methylmalonyl-CoA mutase